jgi:hypothetical protein
MNSRLLRDGFLLALLLIPNLVHEAPPFWAMWIHFSLSFFSCRDWVHLVRRSLSALYQPRIVCDVVAVMIICRRNRRAQGKPAPLSHVVPNPTRHDPGSNCGRAGGKPAINCCTAINSIYTLSFMSSISTLPLPILYIMRKFRDMHLLSRFKIYNPKCYIMKAPSIMIFCHRTLIFINNYNGALNV